MACGSGETFAFDSPAAAAAALITHLSPVGVEAVALACAAGRVLAQDVHADRQSPAADVSAMDGYAVRASEIAAGEATIAGEVRIGCEPPTLARGQALRIVTGACIPPGCDAVLRVEDALVHDDRLRAAVSLKPGDNIRRGGENIGEGEVVICAGARITPGVMGALASFGVATPTLHRRVKLGILVTGDEVRPVGEASPQPWHLRDSNGHTLASMFGATPWIDVLPPRHVVDDASQIEHAAAGLLDACDALFLTGGVSMGTRDYVPGVLKALGANVIFHKLPQRPGKPVLGAIMPGGKLALALPGNPVSVMVTARRIGAPVLAHLGGVRTPEPVTAIRLVDAPPDHAPIWRFMPVTINEQGHGVFVRGKGSGDVVYAARAVGFVEIPPNTPPGGSDLNTFPFYPWIH